MRFFGAGLGSSMLAIIATVIASQRSERGDRLACSNWIAFAPLAIVRIFGDTCHRYAVLGMEVERVATNISPLRGFDVEKWFWFSYCESPEMPTP